jgi:hypothetical protein
VIVTGLDETMRQLEALGAKADNVVRQAATEAATDLRDTWLLREVSGKTGISRAFVRRQARVTRASKKYVGARIFFSSAGIPVEEYNHSRRNAGANSSRSQILVDWVTGGQKVAAGFINQHGKRQQPLSTRNEKRKGQKTYTYGKGKMTDAMGPSLAAAYLDLPEHEVRRQAEVRLTERLSYYLESVFD